MAPWWILRAQAVGLLGLAISVLVLTGTSRTSLGPALLASEVLAAVGGAALLVAAGRYRRLRTPVLLLEIIAVLIAGQLFVSAHRVLIALVVGVPAVVATVTLLLTARAEHR